MPIAEETLTVGLRTEIQFHGWGTQGARGFKVELAGPRPGAQSKNSPGFRLVCTVYVKTVVHKAVHRQKQVLTPERFPSFKAPGGEEGRKASSPRDLTDRPRLAHPAVLTPLGASVHITSMPVSHCLVPAEAFWGHGSPTLPHQVGLVVSGLPCQGSWLLPSAEHLS